MFALGLSKEEPRAGTEEVKEAERLRLGSYPRLESPGAARGVLGSGRGWRRAADPSAACASASGGNSVPATCVWNLSAVRLGFSGWTWEACSREGAEFVIFESSPPRPPATENMTTACDSRRGQPSPSPSPGREDALATLTKAGASAARNDSSQLGEDTGGVRVRAAGEAAGEATRAGGPQRHGASRALRPAGAQGPCRNLGLTAPSQGRPWTPGG